MEQTWGCLLSSQYAYTSWFLNEIAEVLIFLTPVFLSHHFAI